VRMRIVPTMTAPAGRIVVDGGTPVSLTPDASAFIGQLTVNKDGFYKIELQGGPENKLVSASPHYTIDVLEDQPPTVSIAKRVRSTTTACTAGRAFRAICISSVSASSTSNSRGPRRRGVEAEAAEARAR